jgi:Streptomycin adenylyltransferase
VALAATCAGKELRNDNRYYCRRRTPAMTESLWQATLAADVLALLKTDPSVESIWFVGSLGSSSARVDEWSDADIAVVVHDCALGGWQGATDWLAPIGRVWATSVSAEPLRTVTRVVFYDGRRLDLVFFGHSLERPDLPGIEVWARPSGPAPGSSSPLAPPGPLPARDAVQELVNEFRFVASLAVVKLARGDELIGIHLAIECARYCLVLGMLLRDGRWPTAMWSELPRDVGGVAMPGDVGSALSTIEQCVVIFDAHLHAAYHDRALDAGPVLQMIAELRDLRGTGWVRS